MSKEFGERAIRNSMALLNHVRGSIADTRTAIALQQKELQEAAAAARSLRVPGPIIGWVEDVALPLVEPKDVHRTREP